MEESLVASSVKKIISYCYLLAYCPPEQIADLEKVGRSLRLQAALKSGLPEADFFPLAVQEACWRIVSFHQGSTEPDAALVQELTEAACQAGSSTAALTQYQQQMAAIVSLPGRADLKNRLHRRRGCAFCAAPCYYGFFSLISDPDFRILQQALQTESQKPPAQQRLLLILWAFARYQLRSTLGSNLDFITTPHLGNLAFCLYLLATAKSRFPFQEAVVKTLQASNQKLIQERS